MPDILSCRGISNVYGREKPEGRRKNRSLQAGRDRLVLIRFVGGAYLRRRKPPEPLRPRSVPSAGSVEGCHKWIDQVHLLARKEKVQEELACWWEWGVLIRSLG